MSHSPINSDLSAEGAELAARLAPFGQEHLLRWWGDLSEAQRKSLAEQIRAIDFALLSKLNQEQLSSGISNDVSQRAEPAPALRLQDEERRRRSLEARRTGDAALAEGKIAVIVVAGGQGTRLGQACPKGMVPVGPVSGRSLLQILIDRIHAASRRCGAPIPLYLMTSATTHDPLAAFLEQYERFGLSPRDVTLFQQGVMPAVCVETGRVLMASPEALCLSPNGHGGLLEALSSSGCLADAAHRGVEHFFYCQVDNPIAPVCDPKLIGLHLVTGSEMTTVAVPKTGPDERMGNLVSIDGRVQMVEYSELPPEIAAQRNPDGSLRLWAGNTAIHLFDVRFLRRAAADPDLLPYHRAEKSTPCLDEVGRLVKPERPNSIKFERFIFDLLPAARTATVIEARREEAFAPVKNATGKSDTVETAQAAMSALHRKWLQAAGALIDADHPVEINPLFAIDADELSAKLEPGLTIHGPKYFA